MKVTLIVTTLMIFIAGSSLANTYNITSNTSWSATVGTGSCWTCTFNITPGITFTWDEAVTCGTCTFNYGDINITQNITCQGCTFLSDTITTSNVELNLQSNTTTFTSSSLSISGTGYILATAGISMNSSTFNFSSTTPANAYLNMNGGALTLNNSLATFAGTAYLTATSGPISVENNSSLVFGDGTGGSTAHFFGNAPVVNVYDNSSITLKNQGNYFYDNAKPYNYYLTTASASSTPFATKNTNLNCGSGYTNACSANYIYGCATMNNVGAAACTTLALVGTALSAQLSGSHSVLLSWTAGQSIQADRFIVQRSTDNSQWETIGTVAAQAYTDLADNYTFSDPSAPGGNNSYRLKIVDENGVTAYSTMASVTIAITASDKFSLYPNPVTGQFFQLKAASTDPVLVKIFTLSGQLLSLVSLKGQTQYQVGLPASIPHHEYIVVQVIGGDASQAFTVLNE